MANFTFGEAEAVLAKVNAIADHKRVAFTGRLNILRKNGVPIRSATGRGKAATLSFDQVLQMATAVELIQCGLSPQRAGETINQNWWLKADEILSILLRVQPDEHGGRTPSSPQLRISADWVWMIVQEELKELSKNAELKTGDLIEAVPNDIAVRMSRGSTSWSTPLRRALIINAPLLIATVASAIIEFGFATLDEMISDIESLEIDLPQSAKFFERSIELKATHLQLPASEASRASAELSAHKIDEIDLPRRRYLLRTLYRSMSRPALAEVTISAKFEGKISSDIADSQVDELAQLGLIKPEPDEDRNWELTELGRVLAGSISVIADRYVYS